MLVILIIMFCKPNNNLLLMWPKLYIVYWVFPSIFSTYIVVGVGWFPAYDNYVTPTNHNLCLHTC